MTIDELRQRIQKAIEERDTFVVQANQQVVFLNGKIEMLQQLLAELLRLAPDEAGEVKEQTE
jgi:hypothetical protein